MKGEEEESRGGRKQRRGRERYKRRGKEGRESIEEKRRVDEGTGLREKW